MGKQSHTAGSSITYSENIDINCSDFKKFFPSKMHTYANV